MSRFFTNIDNIIIDKLTNVNLSLLIVTFLMLFCFIYFIINEYYLWCNASMSISKALEIEHNLRLIPIACFPTLTLFIYELLNYFTGYNNFIFFEFLIIVSFVIAVIYYVIATVINFTPSPNMFKK